MSTIEREVQNSISSLAEGNPIKKLVRKGAKLDLNGAPP